MRVNYGPKLIPHLIESGVLGRCGIERVGILLGNGIMVSEGDLWRRQRKMIQPAFHRDVLARMLGRISSANLKLCEKWKA